MSFKRMLVLVGLSVFILGCSTDKYNRDGFLAFNKQDNKTIGMRYLLGRGVPQDNEKAFYYFNLAANSGDPFAQSEVGYLYAAGKGVTQNYQKSVYWYQKASEQGLASAQFNLAFLYQHGLGVPQSSVKAQEYLRKSAAHGFKPAISALKKM